MVGILAAVENVFPPVPADTAVALGAFASGGGVVSAPLVFLLTWVANVSSAAGMYALARHAGRRFLNGPVGQRMVRPEALLRLEQLYAHHGVWGIFLSRFIPGIRAVVPPFAGIAGLGAFRALVPVALASGIWYGTLTFLAATAVANLDELKRLLARMNWVTGMLALMLLALAVAVLFVRRRKREPAA